MRSQSFAPIPESDDLSTRHQSSIRVPLTSTWPGIGQNLLDPINYALGASHPHQDHKAPVMRPLLRKRISHQHCKQCLNFHFTIGLLIDLQIAHKLDSLVLVSRRVERNSPTIRSPRRPTKGLPATEAGPNRCWESSILKPKQQKHWVL